jgi:hypothetical protein
MLGAAYGERPLTNSLDKCPRICFSDAVPSTRGARSRGVVTWDGIGARAGNASPVRVAG